MLLQAHNIIGKGEIKKRKPPVEAASKFLLVAVIAVMAMVVGMMIAVVAMMVVGMMIVAIKVRIFRGWRVRSSERAILSHGKRSSALQ